MGIFLSMAYGAYTLFNMYRGSTSGFSPKYESIELGNTGLQSLPVPIIYGTTTAGGNVLWGVDRYYPLDNTGLFLMNLWVIAIAEGEISSVTSVKYNGEDLNDPSASDQTFPDNPNRSYTKPLGTTYEYYTGTGTQDISPFIRTIEDDPPPLVFTAEDTKSASPADRAAITGGLRHLAYIAISDLQMNQKSEIPTVTMTVAGQLVDVWNGSSWTKQYSNNPAWIIRDFLIGGDYDSAAKTVTRRYGIGLTYSRDDDSSLNDSSSRIDDATFYTAAQYCDALITDIDGDGTEARFMLDYVVDQKKPATDILQDMLSTFAGYLIDRGSQVFLYVDRDEAATAAFDMDNIIANSFSYKKTSIDNVPNKIKVLYNDTSLANELGYAIAEDDNDIANRGIKEQEMQLRGIGRYSQASRMAWQYLMAYQYNDIVCKFNISINDMEMEVGDVITVTHDVSGWTAKEFRVMEVNETDKDEMELISIEYTDSIYTDDHGSQAAAATKTTLPHPLKQPSVPASFTIITTYDALDAFPLSMRRSIIKDIKNFYDFSTSSRNIAPIVLTDFITGESIKRLESHAVLPLEFGGTQVQGSGASDGATKITISSVDWVTLYGGSLFGQKMVTFSSTTDGIEHTIQSYGLSGSDTVVTLTVTNGVPKTGQFFVISEQD